MNIIVENREIIYNVQSSKKKSMTLEMNSEGMITIFVPKGFSQKEIEGFVEKNAKAIFKTLDKIENRTYISRDKSYDKDETFLYMGRAIKLSDIITEEVSSLEAQELLKNYYIKETSKIIKKRVKHFEKLIGVKAKSIKVTENPGTWGTCDSLGHLTFNYRLSMAPIEVIDYVVIHELCHIHHMNHDRSFWRRVGSYDKNYKDKQEYLGKFGGFMSI